MFDYVKRMIASIVGRNNHEVNKEPRIIRASEHGIDPKMVSFAAVRTCSILQQRGYKAYVVGGAVRDLLLGVKPKDFDVATDATPEQVKRAQRRAFIIGRRFRLVHVVFGNEIVECSTFRALDASGVRKDASGRVISDNIFGESRLYDQCALLRSVDGGHLRLSRGLRGHSTQDVAHDRLSAGALSRGPGAHDACRAYFCQVGFQD